MIMALQVTPDIALDDKGRIVSTSPRGRKAGSSKPEKPTPDPDANAIPSHERAIAPSYTHARMVELILQYPHWTHAEYARYFGRKVSWFASVVASDGFQAAVDPVRESIPDPFITATMQERMRGLAIHAVEVLQDKLAADEVQDFTVLKALEVGAKSLGMGAAALPTSSTPPEDKGVEALADRLVTALNRAKGRSRNDSEVIDISPSPIKVS